MAVVNFQSVADFEALAAGEYEAVFTIDKVALAPKSNAPTVYVEYILEETNQKVFKPYSLQAKALWGFKRDLTRIGADPEVMMSDEIDFSDLDNAQKSISLICDPLRGAACTIICDEPYWYPLNADGSQTPDSKLRTNFKEVKDPNKL